MVDYISRYGLEYNPFIKNSKEYLVETNEYNEVMFRLNYLLNNIGFGVLLKVQETVKQQTLKTYSMR